MRNIFYLFNKMEENIESQVPYIDETFAFFHRAANPEEVKLLNIIRIEKSRLSREYKDSLKHLVGVVFDKVIQYANYKNPLIPELEVQIMLLDCLTSATSRDIKQSDRLSIEQNILFSVKAVLTRAFGKERERALQLYPGYREERVVNTQPIYDEQIEKKEKKGWFKF